MSLRFQHLKTVYPSFFEQFLSRHPDFQDCSYQQQFDRLVSARFAGNDYHAQNMMKLGHAAETCFLTVESMQKQWARENEIPVRENHWLEDIAVAQIEKFQPDVIYLDDLYAIDRPLRERLREACRNQVKIVGWRNTTTSDYSRFRDLDLVLTSVSETVPKFQQAGVRAEILDHAFEPSILDSVAVAPERDIDLSFAGEFHSSHPQRATLIEQLMKRTPLEVWGQTHRIRLKDQVRWWLSHVGMPQKQISRMRTLRLRYPRQVHPTVYGCDFFEILGRSKITLNCHESFSSKDASNMRLFEATGMGTCLLTDEKPNLKRLFDPDVEVVTFRNAEECIEKVHYLLEHDEQREAIAAAGQRRTLRDHNFSGRVSKMANLLTDLFSSSAA